ncbi:hypothetical protein GGI20_002509 [Coemansia sp. BCRC 34301]|nr:hypothetical protein GGI20_002509 [Coemansia sp. BCRC 34301]
MESHEGPVTKATMEEIRREAGSSHSNLRINSINILEGAPHPLPPTQLMQSAGPAANSPEAAARAESGLLASAVVTRPDASQECGSTTPSSALTDDSARAVFPLRTTSNTLVASLPPRIDTLSPLVQRHAVLVAKPERPGYASPFTEDSDASAPIGTVVSAGTSDKGGFDLPAPPTRPQQQQQQQQQPASAQSASVMPAAETNKRVISERIKSLANRFSSSSLSEQPESPSAHYAMQRRPSNTPSVSERVSLFDQQELLSNDPRLSGLFGKFGMASGRPGMHSRSSSVAGSISRNSDARSSTEAPRGAIGPSYDVSAPRAPATPRSPSMASKSASLGDSDSDGRAASDTAGAGMSASIFGPRTSATPSNKSSDSHHMSKPPSALAVGKYGLDLSDDEDVPGKRQSSPSDSVAAADRQSTIAAGVQVNFLRPLSPAGTHTTNGGPAPDSGYRGVRSDGPGKRRGSIRSTFGTNEDGLYVITDPIDTTASHQPTPSPRAQSGSNFHASRVSSAATSPTGIQTSRTAPVRRAGAVATTPSNHAGSLGEIQRSTSAASHNAESRAAVRARSQSQASAPRSPAPFGAQAELRQTTTRRGHLASPENTDNGISGHLPLALPTLFGNLSRRLVFDPDALTDSVLAKAVLSDSLPSDSGIEEISADDYDAPGTAKAAAMSALVEAVIGTADAGKILPVAEYEQCVREAPALKMRLQSARTRHSLEIRMRDTAKNLVDLHKGNSLGVGMFKGKHPNQAHVDDYNAASANVQQTEAEVAELSAKLRVLEAALRDHQVAVLLSAVKTVVAEATCGRYAAHSSTSLLQRRITELEQSVAASQAAAASERASMVAGHAEVRLGLEEQIRSLQNRSHDANARRISREAEEENPESPLARHSAGLVAERLAGELVVAKEQSQASERQSKMLEARLDDALLKAQAAQHELDELHRQAADMTEVSRAKVEAARAEADAYRQCIRAFSAGLRGMLCPLRLLSGVCDDAEKIKALGSATSASTPPTTPTARTAFTLSHDAISIETLESLVAADQDDSCVSGTVASDLSVWDAERVASAMSLLGSTMAGCSSLYPEAMKVCEAYSRLQHDLGTEQRLREAQGLAITQQRERLAKATYLAESADQRVKEAVDALVEKQADEKGAWAEERQRLFDNIERLTQDVRERQAAIAAHSISHASDSTSVASPSSLPRAAIGSIEPMLTSGQIVDAEAEAIRKQLSSKTAECDQLRQDLESTAHLRRRASEMGITISQLHLTEAALRKQLAELIPLKEAHSKLLHDVEAAKGKSVTHMAEHSSKEPLFMASAATTAVEGASGGFVQGETPTRLPDARHSPTRCRSLPSLRLEHLPTFHPIACYPALAFDGQARLADAQTMTTVSNVDDASDSADASQMLLAYSEKLIHKEDALRSREDELEAVCTAVHVVEAALYKLLPSTPTLSQAGFGSTPRSPTTSGSPQIGQSAWSSSASMSRSSLRNRSASFFQGLRTNYLGAGDSTESSSPSVLTVQTDAQHRTNGYPLTPTRASGADSALLAVQSLAPLVQMVVAEVRRLKLLAVDLEDQSRETRMELLHAQGRLADLQNMCAQRSRQEDAVQQDITHVLGQISHLRAKVVQLEDEKAACENEARGLRKRCREMEDTTAEKVLRLIVDRVGTGDLARQAMVASTSAEAVVETNQLDDECKPAAAATTIMPTKFAVLGSVSVSHPEAGEIRAEFNELLHQIIARRDEDIERIQALADAWRDDARRASLANERKAWSMATRGIQTT